MTVDTPRRGLQSRLIRVFAVQATLVSLATALGVYAAYVIAEDYLVKQALLGEAAHYWGLVEAHGGSYPLPDTQNMQALLAPVDDPTGLPDPFQTLPADFFGRVAYHGREPLVLVSERDGWRLFLLFKEEQVSRLAFFFGVAPLTVVLILIYLASWFTFRQSQRLISPVTRLARVLDSADLQGSDGLDEKLSSFHGIDADIDALLAALQHYHGRLRRFVDRERAFTRDASHELRTPLAVLRGSLDILQTQTTLNRQQEKVLDRMRHTVRSMESLIETLLLLAREEGMHSEAQEVCLGDLVPAVLDQVKDALGCPDTLVTLTVHGELRVRAAASVIGIILTNLVRNAIQYGEGRPVEVKLDSRFLTVTDHGRGMTREQLDRAFQPFYRAQADGSGHGLGLAIVARLCERFGWPVNAYSTPGEGTSITILLAPSPA